MTKYLFVVLASSELGFGHLNRCINLTKKIKTRSISFFIIGDIKAEKILRDQQIKCFKFLNIKKLKNINVKFKDDIFFDKVIFDISNPNFKFYRDFEKKLISPIRIRSNHIIIIDSDYQNQLIKNRTALYDMLIIPYFQKREIKKKKKNILIGSKYAMLEKRYSYLKKSIISKNVEKVLLSCGGADPNQDTLKVLMALNSFNKKLKVKVIIGPFFSKKLISNIKILSKSFAHSISLIENETNLKKYFTWCDLAITSSGLTKYELAACGVPSISIALDYQSEEFNKVMQRKNILVNANYDISLVKLKYLINNLMINYKKRLNISRTAQKLVDGNGLQRVVNAIEKL